VAAPQWHEMRRRRMALRDAGHVHAHIAAATRHAALHNRALLFPANRPISSVEPSVIA
jgi:hypothetical protein